MRRARSASLYKSKGIASIQLGGHQEKIKQERDERENGALNAKRARRQKRIRHVVAHVERDGRPARRLLLGFKLGETTGAALACPLYQAKTALALSRWRHQGEHTTHLALDALVTRRKLTHRRGQVRLGKEAHRIDALRDGR